MEQTEHQDLHVGGFLDLVEVSPAKKQFADYFKQCLANSGVDFQTLDSKNYAMSVDEREFDPPAPPRPDSPAWAYFYGNLLVELKCMADNLAPENEYKRGLLESRIEPLKRKMKVHYQQLDWRGKLDAKMDDWKNGKLTTFQKVKAMVASKAVADDVDGYIDLYRSNSHFQFGDDDPYHHYMPKSNEDKWVAYQKFTWDKTASNADTGAYGAALKPLMAALDGGLAKTPLKAAVTAALQSSDSALVGQLVAAFCKATPSACGAAGAADEEMVGSVLNMVGVKGKMTADQANTVSQMLRGVAGPDLSGKTAAEATTILIDTATEDKIAQYYHAAAIVKNIGNCSPGQLVVALTFGNIPDLFAQLFVGPNNMQDFVAANESGFAEFMDSVGSLNKACADLAKSLNDACAAADAGLSKAGVASPGAGAFLKASGLAAVAGGPVTPESLFLAPKLNDVASSLTGGSSFMAAVNCVAAAQYLATDEYTSSVVAKLTAETLMPPASGMPGPLLNAVGQAALEKDFGDKVASATSDFLVKAGKVAVPSDTMTGAVEEAFANIVPAAEAVQQAQDAASAKFMALTLDSGLADVGSLEVQYKC